MRRIGLMAFACVCVGCAVDRPPPSVVSITDVADALFETVATCEAEVAGHVVEVAHPAAWFAADDCTRFDPDGPAVDDAEAPVAIVFGAVPSAPIQGREPTSGTVDGRPWIRVFESSRDGDVLVRHLVYYITLDPADGEPTMVAATSTSASGDHELNAAVLDRIVARLDFRD